MSTANDTRMVKLAELWERTSARGSRYFSGFMGDAQVLLFDGGEKPHPTRQGETVRVWRLMVQGARSIAAPTGQGWCRRKEPRAGAVMTAPARPARATSGRLWPREQRMYLMDDLRAAAVQLIEQIDRIKASPDCSEEQYCERITDYWNAGGWLAELLIAERIEGNITKELRQQDGWIRIFVPRDELLSKAHHTMDYEVGHALDLVLEEYDGVVKVVTTGITDDDDDFPFGPDLHHQLDELAEVSPGPRKPPKGVLRVVSDPFEADDTWPEW
jgi:hypothetical protein